MSGLSRRQFIGGSTAATVAASLTRANVPEPERGNTGGTIPGPINNPVDRENPDLLAPPSTDAGLLPNLKYSMSDAHMHLLDGGWSRQVNMQQLPIATTLTGVEMRLEPGAIRELHWHLQSEWALMLTGRAQVTAVDDHGRNFIGDVGEGDLWFFPAGYPHSIQGLKEGCEFLLVFDAGDFSEFNTFMVTDWMDHTPRSVLAKNFGVPGNAFANLPLESARYIFPGTVPPPASSNAVRSPAGTVPQSFTHRLTAQAPISTSGGSVRIVDSANFPPSTTTAASLVEINPGGMRELHWHPNADEWQYYISGQGRMTVFAAGGEANTFDYQAGDVGYIPQPMGHYIENTGTGTLRFLEMFRSSYYADVSLDTWLALTPPEMIRATLNLDQRTISKLRKSETPVVG
ncbi:MAG TPA: oxalate decarboxylase family bicupin [Solirubrobacteraceae bacterium]|nr:oxalate decarboxylase family bicupin [Solirubrobacteraceae bacterium]